MAFITCIVNHRCVNNHWSFLPAGHTYPVYFSSPELNLLLQEEWKSMETASTNPTVARIAPYSYDRQIYEILTAIWKAQTQGFFTFFFFYYECYYGGRNILSFLPLSQIPAAWVMIIYLLPSFPEEASLIQSCFCLLLLHLLKSLPIFNQPLRRFQRFETTIPCKNWVWIEDKDPNQHHHRRKGFRASSVVTCFAQPAHAGLLHNNLLSWIRGTGGWYKSHDAAKEVGRLWKVL